MFDRLDEPDGRARAGRPSVGDGVAGARRGRRLAVTLRRSRVPAPRPAARRASRRACRSLYLPYLFARSHGVRATSRSPSALGDELGY